jgi:hypothetical protein
MQKTRGFMGQEDDSDFHVQPFNHKTEVPFSDRALIHLALGQGTNQGVATVDLWKPLKQ